MSVFHGLTQAAPCVLCKTGWFICFLRELQPLSVCVLSVIRVSDKHTDVDVSPKKPKVYLFVCICHLRLRDMLCIWHMPHPHWLFLPCLSSLQPSKPSWREGVPGVRSDLSAPEGSFTKQKAHSGWWIGGNQALLSNSMTEMFLALLHFMG